MDSDYGMGRGSIEEKGATEYPWTYSQRNRDEPSFAIESYRNREEWASDCIQPIVYEAVRNVCICHMFRLPVYKDADFRLD